MCERQALQCIIPPHMLERLLDSPKAAVRKAVLAAITASAEARALRSVVGPMTASMTAMSSPTAKKNRLIYTLRNLPPVPFLLPGKLVRKEGDPKTTDAAVNEAYDFSGTTYDFYSKVHGRNSLDGNGMTLVSSVHVGRDFNNAFWNGQQMAYGDGDGEVFQRFTKSLDVVGHELTHGVVTFTSNLEYQGESGALNEHLADVFGSLVKQWKKSQTAAQASWLIGEELLVPAPTRKALRSMAAPGTAYLGDPDLGDDPQPDHISKKFTGSEDNGGVHINSGIPNLAFCAAAKQIGGKAWEKAGRIWYAAMLGANKQTDFAEFAKLTRSIAGSIYGVGSAEQKAVDDGWKKVGL
jgi:Zn-dependent metalloprotease